MHVFLTVLFIIICLVITKWWQFYDWLHFSLVTRVLPVPLHRPPASGSISRAKVSFTRDLRQVSTFVRLCLQHLQGQDNKIRNFFFSKSVVIFVSGIFSHWFYLPMLCDINLWDGPSALGWMNLTWCVITAWKKSQFQQQHVKQPLGLKWLLHSLPAI